MKKLKQILTVLILLTCCSESGAQPYTPYPSVQDTCLEKKFSLVFYMVQDSMYTNMRGGLPTNSIITNVKLQNAVDTLNRRFKPICVSFEKCTTIYIPSYRYKGWYNASTEAMITNAWYTPNTINVYVVDTVFAFSGSELSGYTYRPTPANLASPKKDLIVVAADSFEVYNFGLFVHLMGHYFGLPHTYEEINPGSPASPPPPPTVTSHEFAAGLSPNCQLHGDGFCDTEADNYNSLVTQDGMGNYYVPPLDNIMSYYLGTRCRFSPMQYRAMVYNILTKRLYLH